VDVASATDPSEVTQSTTSSVCGGASLRWVKLVWGR
jgi:hypothetical protein